VSSTPGGPEARAGKLLHGDGKTKYLDNVLLLEDEELCNVSDSDEHDDLSSEHDGESNTPAELLGLLVAHSSSGPGTAQDLANKHPTQVEAMMLWDIYTQNVEPLCKILHTPTVGAMAASTSLNPEAASKNDECLLFIIYYSAVMSMSEDDCLRDFNRSRQNLMAHYRSAFCQALVNASWLKTKALTVLQAYTLFLIVMRGHIDADTFWILTGIAIRIAQRMGLHRDGEKLDLVPFEVQLRRRVFWQLLPLDGYAGQVSGCGISISPDTWDTLPPQNINDDQICPNMSQIPRDQIKATEMIFVLSRIELSNFYNRTGVQMKQGGSRQFRDGEEVQRLIDEVEGLIETKFFRYCDILNPLHFYTTGIMRSAINAVRLRTRMQPLLDQTIDDNQRRELCNLAENVLDTNSAIWNNPSTKGFRWAMQAFFLWDALLCILLSLAKVDFYSPRELNTAWRKVEEVFNNYQGLAKSKKSLHLSIGRITLKAWIANPPTGLGSAEQPAFITTLRNQAQAKANKRQSGNTSTNGEIGFPGAADPENRDDTGAGLMDLDGDFVLDAADWAFWDQLCEGSDMTWDTTQ
jgi:hypothetical protein